MEIKVNNPVFAVFEEDNCRFEGLDDEGKIIDLRISVGKIERIVITPTDDAQLTIKDLKNRPDLIGKGEEYTVS